MKKVYIIYNGFDNGEEYEDAFYGIDIIAVCDTKEVAIAYLLSIKNDGKWFRQRYPIDPESSSSKPREVEGSEVSNVVWDNEKLELRFYSYQCYCVTNRLYIKEHDLIGGIA